MQNKQLAKVLRNRPEKYPHQLEQHYGRVLDRIMELWGSAEADRYFFDLLVDERGNRAGFPPKVAEEIFFLSEMHALLYRVKAEAKASLGETERIIRAEEKAKEFRAALESRGIKFVPTEFFRCVSAGDVSAVVLFVNAGMGIDTQNEQGWTPLMVALFEGREEVALFLIKKGASVHFSDRSGYRPIHWAAFQGYSTVIQEIASRGGDVNANTNFAWTPLLQAATRGHARAVETLLALGANVNGQDNEGWTPLHKACSNDHRDVVRLLLKHGSSVDAAHCDGMTALHIAVRLGHKVLAALLLKAGASANRADQNGVTPLHLAAGQRDMTLTDILLGSGAAVSPTDQRGATPLVWAVEAGALAVIRRLIGAGARIEETLVPRAAEREAAASGRFQVGRVLSTAANLIRSPEILVRGGGSRLHEYVARNDIAGVQHEIANGANVDAIGPNGMTPIEMAAAQGNINLWGVLVEQRAARMK